MGDYYNQSKKSLGRLSLFHFLDEQEMKKIILGKEESENLLKKIKYK